MSIANVNGVDIHYDLVGETGPVLVFANALGTDLVMWEPQAEAFKNEFRVLRYDMRGHGASASPQGPYTVELLSRDVLALIKHLGFDKINFCGTAVGGMVGQWLGINASHKLDKLILVSTAASVPESTFEDKIKAIREKGIVDITDSMADLWFSRNFQKASSCQPDQLRHVTIAATQEGYIACCEAIVAADFKADLHKINTPTLCIPGPEDNLVNMAKTKEIVEQIPNSRLEIIGDGAYLINLEQPEKFNKVLRNFLES